MKTRRNVNDNTINREKKHRSGNQAQNAHMTRLATALLGNSIAIPSNTEFKKREERIGKKRHLTTKNNNEIKKRKIR